MSRKYTFRDQDRIYFITLTLVHWIDLFIRNEYKQILLNSWKFCRERKGLEIYGWCIMTSHAHLLISARDRNIDDIVDEMKKITTNRILAAVSENSFESRKDWMLNLMKTSGRSIHQENRVWRPGSHPVELDEPWMAHQKLDYIHYNPVEAGFVEYPEEYLYSSARNYEGKRGLIEVELLEPYVV